MAVPELLATKDRFIAQLAVSMRPRTVRKYDYGISEFIGFLRSSNSGVGIFRDLRRRHAESWMCSLARRPIKSSTRGKKITYVRLFLERIVDWEWDEAPRERIFRMADMPPEDQYLPRPLSRETDRLLQEDLSRRNTVPSKAILLLRATGLRSQELLDLEVDSLAHPSPGQWSLKVPLGKLRTERVIPIEPKTAGLFQELIRLRGTPPPAPDPETGKPTRYLLQWPDGRRFLYDTLRFYLGAVEREARFPEHPTLHRLRHTYATELLRAGMRLEIIMKLLGHKSLRMTLRYLAVSDAQVREQYERALERLPDLEDLAGISPRRLSQRRSGPDPRILTTLQDVATRLEALRRDRSKGEERRRLQRFVERVRRLHHDLSDLPLFSS